MMAKKKKKNKVKVTSIPITKPEERDLRVEPDEWYKAEFLEAELGSGQYGPWIKLIFELRNGKFQESGKSAKKWKVSRLMNAEIAEGSPLNEFAKVFTGKKKLKVGKSLDLTTYYGNKYLVLVEDRKKKKGETRIYQQIKRIKKSKKK